MSNAQVCASVIEQGVLVYTELQGFLETWHISDRIIPKLIGLIMKFKTALHLMEF